ncbi:MAG: hypothetical protein LC800_01455 [Acidobacteria bacterium]|nr:hypothetical protein [Acidobacteriota bacterium]
MATQQLPPQSLEDRLKQLEEQLRGLTQAKSPLEAFLAKWLPGITIVAMIGFAFWLGGLSNKIEASSSRTEQLINWKDTVTTRLSVIETEIKGVNNELERLREGQERVTTQLDNMDAKLDGLRR